MMRIFTTAFTVTAIFLVGVGVWAIFAFDFGIAIGCLTLALLLIAMAGKAPATRTLDKSSGVRVAGPSEPAISQSPLAATNDNDTCSEDDGGAIPLLMLAGDEDDEDAILALLIDTKNPMLVGISEESGFIHTLVFPNAATRLLSEDDLKDCA